VLSAAVQDELRLSAVRGSDNCVNDMVVQAIGAEQRMRQHVHGASAKSFAHR
jgi:hypothetical protein